MSVQPDGVTYDTVENVAKRYNYGVHHIRKLCRDYQNGDVVKGLKAAKCKVSTHKGRRWVVDVFDAEMKLEPKIEIYAGESKRNVSKTAKPKGKSRPVSDDTDNFDWL